MSGAKPVLVRLLTSILMGLIVATSLFVLVNVIHISLTPDSVRFAIQDYAQRLSSKSFPDQTEPKYKIRLVSLRSDLTAGVGRILRSDLAKIVNRLDHAKASVIVIDGNLAEPSPSDGALSDAIADLQYAKVLIPLQFSPRESGHCDGRTTLASAGPAAAGEVTWPAAYDAARWHRVRFVSVEVDQDIGGVTRSLCPFTTGWWTPSSASAPQKIIVPALAVTATYLIQPSALPSRWSTALRSQGALPGLPDPIRNGLADEDFTPKRLRYVVGDDAERSPDNPMIAPGIAEFPTEVLLGNDGDLSDLSGSVVIVGSKDPATRDFQMTPLGRMSGLLLTANQLAAVSGAAYLESEDHGPAAYVAEMAFVLSGCLLFFLLFDAVPMWLVPSLYWDAAPRWRPVSIVLGTCWFVATSVFVGATLLLCAVIVAALGITHGVSPDPTVTMLAIVAERLIHAGAALDLRLDHWVESLISHRESAAALPPDETERLSESADAKEGP